MKEITSEEQLNEVLKNIPIKDDAHRNDIVCALIGHSRIQTLCLGYYNCARCGAQLGDSLASIYVDAEKTVIVGHNCEACQENYEKCSWKDKVFAPDPFVKPPLEDL